MLPTETSVVALGKKSAFRFRIERWGAQGCCPRVWNLPLRLPHQLARRVDELVPVIEKLIGECFILLRCCASMPCTCKGSDRHLAVLPFVSDHNRRVRPPPIGRFELSFDRSRARLHVQPEPAGPKITDQSHRRVPTRLVGHNYIAIQRRCPNRLLPERQQKPS